MEIILIIGTDRDLGNLLIQTLSAEGFLIDLAYERETGIEKVRNNCYLLIILDAMTPAGDNDFSVLRKIRSEGNVPTLVLSGRADHEDRIKAFEMGADDYLLKPFNPRELVARMHAVLRRTGLNGVAGAPVQNRKRLHVGDVEMDTGTRLVLRSGQKIALTSVEFRVLEILLNHAGNLVSREELTQKALGRTFCVYDRSIDVHVSKLRKKLGSEVSGLERIKAIRSEGYLYALPWVPENEPWA
jgi:two-component system, OmpR family, response regulator CpxR